MLWEYLWGVRPGKSVADVSRAAGGGESNKPCSLGCRKLGGLVFIRYSDVFFAFAAFAELNCCCWFGLAFSAIPHTSQPGTAKRREKTEEYDRTGI